MNCHEFEMRMEALLEGLLDPAAQDACLTHTR